jgi:hypothetical protein
MMIKPKFFQIITLCMITILIANYGGTAAIKEHEQISKLKAGKWWPAVKTRLETLIAENAGKNKKVVFDFDNTIICRDIGEATFALLVQDKKLTLPNIPTDVSPSCTLATGTLSPKNNQYLITYYERFLSTTGHQSRDTSPHSNAYAWVVQIMAGITPADIVLYTKNAFNEGTAEKDSTDPNLHVSKINGYLQPFFYTEMVDLLGVLLKNHFDVYIISASNVWSVRWMVLEKLNPRIQDRYGEGIKIPPDHIFGINTLLKDKRTGMLYKDPILVKENQAYASLEDEELKHYELTSQIVYPLTAYFGKTAAILEHVTMSRPFLVAGDSPNDHPMLNLAENRLWIARLEKMDYQVKTIVQIVQSLPGTWLIQPVLYENSPGFVSGVGDLNERLRTRPAMKKN